MWTRLWKTRGEVVKGTKGTRVHTPFFLSHHSCLFFWRRPCQSSCVNGDPQASAQLQKSQTAKDRCKPRYESPHNGADRQGALTGGMAGAPRPPRFHASASFVCLDCRSKRCCCASSPQRGKHDLLNPKTGPQAGQSCVSPQVVLKETSVKVQLEQATSLQASLQTCGKLLTMNLRLAAAEVLRLNYTHVPF